MRRKQTQRGIQKKQDYNDGAALIIIKQVRRNRKDRISHAVLPGLEYGSCCAYCGGGGAVVPTAATKEVQG
jgi:hypothetical protein